MIKELQHMISYDSKGKMLEGHKKYKLHLLSNIPASDFWSVIVYDSFNRLIIHTDQSWPSIYSKKKILSIMMMVRLMPGSAQNLLKE
jgi:hypothetical protein